MTYVVSIPILILLLIAKVAGLEAFRVKPPPCSSEIYCFGDLLHTVQMASIYEDSKTFVDLKMKRPPHETLNSFKAFMNRTNQSPSISQIENYVNETFEPAGSEFMEFVPSDWKPNPKFLMKIRDLDLRTFAADLNEIWKLLGRKMTEDVRLHSDLYSIIYVPNPVIVPGGRFREFYYWDSYWIIKGLLLSEMYDTVEGMLTNFVSIVDKYGFIPNGGRIYYTMRSQPPMLIPMVEEYLLVTKNYAWLRKNLWLLEKEFDFWMTKRTVRVMKNGEYYTLARYFEESSGPRPESYKEDYINGLRYPTAEEKDNYYAELKSGAETGWDFGSRWFIVNGTNKGNLTDLKTRSIIPVDLNAIIYRNAVLLSEYNEMVNNITGALYFKNRAEEWLHAVTEVLWHNELGTWLDYDILYNVRRNYFYPSNILPLWSGCYQPGKREVFVSKVLKYLENTRVMDNAGGFPSSLEYTGEQWDFPNAWAPMQHFAVMSLDNTKDPWAQRLAYELCQRWVRGNYKVFQDTHAMFEKYDASSPGGYGGGGEYDVQLGFGWSNGVIMDFLDKYGDRLSAQNYFLPSDAVERHGHKSRASGLSVVSYILILIICLAAHFLK